MTAIRIPVAGTSHDLRERDPGVHGDHSDVPYGRGERATERRARLARADRFVAAGCALLLLAAGSRIGSLSVSTDWHVLDVAVLINGLLFLVVARALARG